MIFCAYTPSKKFQPTRQVEFCTGCGAEIKKGRNRKYCSACLELSFSRQRKLHYEVKKAIKAGALAPITESTACVDCGFPAACYDHRDWRAPLAVEPVCKSCNNRRGPAANLLP